MTSRRTLTTVLISSGAAGTLLLAGCSGTPAAPGSNPDAALTVAASVYPLEWVVAQVGGGDVEVLSITPAGVEPHDIELSPSTVRALGSADLAVYISDFQPAVDDAIGTTGVTALDAAAVVSLHEYGEDGDHDHEEEHADDEHADDEHADDDHADEHDHGAFDPHFWLDPELLAEFAGGVAAELAILDPANADTYAANADAVAADLMALDDAFATGLAQCERSEIFVSHEAFGYLTERYGLTQEGLSGLDPEAEPSPARLREIAALIEEHGATTIFTETLVSSSVADALASDVGATTAVLDPVESAAEGDSYIDVMSRNLDALRTGLGCA